MEASRKIFQGGGKMLLLALLVWCSPLWAMELKQFQEKMEKEIASLPKTVKVSVHIESLGKGDVVFSKNADGLLIPASNMKLVTAAAALRHLGPDFTFRTAVLRRGRQLVIRGSGDPYLVSERLYLLARAVARSGIKDVQSIQVDNGAFDGDYRGLIDWDESGEPFTALVSATSLNFNSLEVHARVIGGKVVAETGPLAHRYAEIKNRASVTGGRSKSLSLRPVGRSGEREVFELSGQLGREAAPAVVYATVQNPAGYIAHVFAALLKQEGVSVEKEYGGLYREGGGGLELVAETESPPLMDLIRLFNTYSNNFMTEQVFVRLSGRKGDSYPEAMSVEKARSVARSLLPEGKACAGAVIMNGSGLSWDSRLSARCLLETVQQSYRDFRSFADLIGSLPVGGATGTLKSRFRNLGGETLPERVRAKTGTLWSRGAVASLVGLTRTASGEVVVFAFLANDERRTTSALHQLREWEDQCIGHLQRLQWP
jgi:serine-type D-Ala-D-Ala carboxypeptidase/endopeptidase (penicillin-binding protein 4)